MFYLPPFFVIFLLCGIQLPHTNGQDQQSNLELNYDIGKYKYIERKKDLVLTCKNRINKEYISWAYPNVPQDRLKIEHGINSTLTVKDANDEIAGTYRCSVQYIKPDGNTVQIENSIQVVSIPLITPGGTGINVKSGKPLTLQCIILGGVPDPVFKNWEIRHEDKSLPRNVIKSHDNDDDYNLPEDHQTITESTQRWLLHNNDKGQAIGKLMIKEVQIDDAGNYTCTAKSEIGEDKKIFYVKVADGGTGGLGGGAIAGICIAIVLQLSL